jgi:5-formyltetrahydrofolate cyclo-ligase
VKNSEGNPIRAHYRTLRENLSPKLQLEHAELACKAFLATDLISSCGTTAAYMAMAGELDPSPLLAALDQQGCRLCLPVIEPHKQMVFRRYRPTDVLVSNRYRIPEPASDQPIIERRDITVMLLPVVAYDDAGTRLGMGAGYYDRYLGGPRKGGPREGIREESPEQGPLLIGLAHSVQRSSNPLPRQSWDVPLNGILTEQGLRLFD